MSKSSSEFRQLDVMIEELRTIRSEFLGQEVDEKRAEELSGKDAFQKSKLFLNVHLKELREDIDKLTEMKRNLGDGMDRNADTIKLESKNRKNLEEAVRKFKEMQKLFVTDLKRFDAGKSDLTQADIEERQKSVQIIYKDIQDLTRKNSRVKPLVTEEEEQGATTRREQRREKRRQEREKRRRDRKGSSAADEPEEIQMTEQEMQFQDQVMENEREQDELLDEISKGMDELKQLSLDMNKTLHLQNNMLDTIEKKVDNNITKLKTANARLQEILDSQGGVTTWCPRVFFLIVLVALVVYILGLV